MDMVESYPSEPTGPAGVAGPTLLPGSAESAGSAVVPGATEPTVPTRIVEVGERVRPANEGDLGYVYSIYRFYDLDGRLLYLGSSDRVRQRVTDLETGRPRGLPLGHDDGPKPWWREASRVELEHLPPGTTEAEAQAEERRQIESYRPLYNRQFNGRYFDRDRFEHAMDTAHFEVDVATSEHERHDGVIRPLDRVAAESEQAADRLRPSGAGRLRYGMRQPGLPEPQGLEPTPARNAEAPPVTGSDTTMAPRPRRSRRFEGPGSIAGVILVSLVLLALSVAAIVISVQAVS